MYSCTSQIVLSVGLGSGTGGGISMRTINNTLAMVPSGVQKERMRPKDMFAQT